MPYAPTVNDNSGQILANHQVQGAYTRMQGKIALGEGIEEAGQAIGSGFSMGLGKAQENRIASDGANAKFDMLKDYKKTDGSPLMTQETIEKFDTMPLGKRQAIVQTSEAMMDYDLKKWMYQTQYNAQNNRINASMLNQNQVPANQVPMGANTAPAATNAGTQPFMIGSEIQTRPAYQQR